jgi:hypothetical protein
LLKTSWAEGMAQVVKHVPMKHETLISNPSIEGKKGLLKPQGFSCTFCNKKDVKVNHFYHKHAINV